ncbi:MAG: YbaK/EbsC family protein [Rhodospirillaceae bacterium]|nr:YbaK/EbsC family protein [Rhodospirillaceae bacterium]
MADAPLPAAARRVQAAIEAAGVPARVVVFADTTRTAADAAAAIGCTVAQIAKSLVFRTDPGDRPVLVVASGVNRVDERAVAAVLADETGGARIKRADADFVRASSGYAIGGVPPVGHATPPLVVLDRDLLALPEIWAAAGTPNAVVRLAPDQLQALTGGTVATIAKSA